MSFGEGLRSLWMHWGCLGLTAAAGLEVAARIREKRRENRVDMASRQRLNRELRSVASETEAIAAVRQIMIRVLREGRSTAANDASGRGDARFACDLAVEIILEDDCAASNDEGTPKRVAARLKNISSSGFALSLKDPLPPQQVVLIFSEGEAPINVLGELIWCDRQTDGAISAGGRFVRVLCPDNLPRPEMALAPQ